MKATIVVVDDDKQIRFLVRSVLEAEGCAVQEAADCSALRELLRGTAPDVVILDLRLPDGDGLGLLPEVKRDWPKSKVIILTGFGTVEAAEAAYKVDDVYLQSKPFDAEMLKAMVGLALAPKTPLQGSQRQEN
jgi:DNA-binding NtrC family response regulator